MAIKFNNLVVGKMVTAQPMAGVGVSLLKSVAFPKPKLTPAYNVEMVNPIPQDDLVQILSYIEQGHNELRNLGELEYLGGGQFGAVFGYKNYAIKINKGWQDTPFEDGQILKQLQHVKTIVKLYAIIDDVAIVTERVNGMTVGDYVAVGHVEKFVNPTYTDVYKDGLKEIVLSGFDPRDLHNANVLISRDTGLPIIVDVGYFLTSSTSYHSKDSVDLKSDWSTRYALRHCDEMREYVKEKQIELGLLKPDEPEEPKQAIQTERAEPHFRGGFVGHIGHASLIKFEPHDFKIMDKDVINNAINALKPQIDFNLDFAKFNKISMFGVGHKFSFNPIVFNKNVHGMEEIVFKNV